MSPAAFSKFFVRHRCGASGPLLRSPFHGPGQIAISRLQPNWQNSEPCLENLHEIQGLVVGGGIGGSFWLPSPKLPSGRVTVIDLPNSLFESKQLWSELTARIPVQSMLVSYPSSARLKPLLAKIAGSGAHLLPLGNPHPILDIATAVYGDRHSDLTTLAALAGIPSFEFRESQFAEVSPESSAAWICHATDYIDPFNGRPTNIERIAEILGDWRRMLQRNHYIASCAGVARWKRRRMAQLLFNGHSTLRQYRSPKAALKYAQAQGKAVAVWTSRMNATLPAMAEAGNLPLCRMEDGFIRSAGLGSALAPPASVVIDRQGIYFDPSRPSDLETLLEKTVFSARLLSRAGLLIESLRSKHVSKYAAGGDVPAIHASSTQRVILVPGQVADDLSLQLGTGAIGCNMALLQTVRRRNPDAFIIYRPHPDVQAGHRRGAIPNPVTLGLADQLINSGSITRLINKVDEVHTMTSLTGFEALLRGRIVQLYGQPFYAGWGLTTDHLPVQRRQRRLQLEELVAGALILYPNYVDPATGLLCGPETLIARLDQPDFWRPSLLMRLRGLQGSCRRTITRWAIADA